MDIEINKIFYHILYYGGVIMKKILATVLAASVFTSALVGCSSNNGASEGNGNAENTRDKVVKVFQLKVEINDALQDLAKKYEEETGVKVEVTSVGGGADYGAALKAEFQKGTEPDIFMIQGRRLRGLVSQGR